MTLKKTRPENPYLDERYWLSDDPEDFMIWGGQEIGWVHKRDADKMVFNIELPK